MDFFKDIYPAESETIANNVTNFYAYPQLPLLVLMVTAGSKVSFTTRIVVTFLLQAIVVGAMPFVAHFSPWVTYGTMLILGVCTAVLQASLIGFASQFPPLFSQAIMAGQGVAGIIASFGRIIFKAVLPGAVRLSAVLYFEVGCATLILCTLGYMYLVGMPFAKYHLSRSRARRGSISSSIARSSVRDADAYSTLDARSPSPAPSADKHINAVIASPLLSEPGRKYSAVTLRLLAESRLGLVDGEGDDEEFDPITAPPGLNEIQLPFCGPSVRRKWRILKATGLMCFTVTAVYTVTFTVFPGVTDDIAYRGNIPGATPYVMNTMNWWLIILTTMFNVFDTIGRSLPAKVPPCQPRVLAIFPVARTVFIPLFTFGLIWSTWNDWATVVLMVVFALTNGYVTSASFMVGPGLVPHQHREEAGFIMSLFLQMGILLGSQIARAFANVQAAT